MGALSDVGGRGNRPSGRCGVTRRSPDSQRTCGNLRAPLLSTQIDRQVREATRDGRSLYAVDAELIERLAPDVIVTQDLCTVCAVSSGELGSACPVGASVISLDPSTLDEVAASIEALAEALSVPERGASSQPRCAAPSTRSDAR